MSQQLTAIWNTYGMVGDEQERAAAVGAKMAAQTAVDFQDIATAMQNAAAPAAQMGVEYNQLAAIIATVGDVTQQSASTIGNAYKTIFSRFQQLKAEGTDGEVTLSSVSAQLQNLGIHVLDSAGNLRELGAVINEVGQNWDNWTQTQQTAIAQIVGGTRQYGQFLALMENFDKYQKNLNAAATEDGSTLEQQYEQALDSIESRAENAGEAWKRAFSEVITADQIKTFYGALEQVGEIVGGILKSLGGAPGILTILIGMLSKQLIPLAGQAGAALQTLWTNRNTESRQASIRKDFGQSENAIKGNSQLSETEKQIALQKNEFSKQTALINEQINTALKTATGEYRTQLEMYQQLLSKAQERYQASLDEEQAAERGVAAHQRALDILKQSLVVAQDLANAELISANNGVAEATNEFNAQNARVSEARGLVSGAQREVDLAQRTVDTSASAEPRAANEQKLAQARQNLATATELLREEEQKLAEAQKKLDAAQSSAKEAQKAKNLTDQHLAANQLINDYNAMAQALTKFDQGEMTIEELKLALDKVTSSMRDLNKTASGGETDVMREKFQDLGNDINNVTDRGEELEQVLRDLAELKQALGSGFDLDLQTDAADESLEAHDNLEQSRRRQDAARRGAGNPPPPGGGDNSTGVNAKAVGESVMALASMAAALTTVVNTVKTLKSIWFEDSDATVIEKIGMTITAVGGLLMGIVPVIGLIGNEAVMTALKINTALGPLGLVILGITAALVGVIAVIGLISDAIKRASPEFKLQKAKEEAKAFEDALKDAKDEATALQEAFNKYDQVQDALKDCTRGTQEWKDALKAANDQVLEMLNTYPELSKFITKDADGLLTISKEGQNLLQERADQKVIDTQAALTLSNQNVRERQIDVSRSNLIKDYSGALSATKTYTYDDGYGNTSQSSYTGSQLSSVINNHLEEILSSTDLEKTVQDIFDKEQLQGNVDEWVQQLQKMVPDLQELDAEILAATEAKRIENEQIAESIIQNDKALDGIKENDAMAAGGKVYSKLIDKYYEDELKRARSRGAFNTGTDDSKASFAEYAKGMGLDVFNVTNYKGSGSNASVVYEYIDEEGKKQTGEATAEMIARFNAAAKAGEDLSNAMVKLNNEVEKLNKPDDQGGDAGDRALSSFLANGNLENANQGEFKDIQSDVSEFDSAEAYLKDKFGDDLTEIAEMAGYNSAEEFVAAFESSLDIDWSVIPKGLQKYEGLSLAQAKRMAEVYETAMADGGEEAAKAYTDGLDYILKDVSQKDMEKVLDQLSFIDWSNWDAGKDVIAIMDSLGYSVDTTTDEWNNFTNAMRDSFDAVPDIEKLNADLQQLNEIASDISLGDIISKEDYENLKAYNIELTKYFSLLSDGSAVFTGDPLDFKQAVEETGKKALMDAAKELQDTAAEVQAQYDEALAAAGGTKESLQSLRQSQNRVEQNAETGESENKYWVSDVAKQLAFLESMDFDSSKIEEWKKAITLDENGEYHSTVETLQEIGNAVDEMAPKWQEAGENAETYQQQVQRVANQIAIQADSFKQLKEDLSQLNLTEEQYSQAMGVGAQKLINAERWEGLDVDEVERYAEHIQSAAKKSDMLADSLEDDEEAAEDVARATKKLNQGVDKLANGFEDWSSILKESDASSEEYCEALDGMKNAMSDILDISEDFLSDDFLLENMDDIKLAAEGDADAIDRLRQAALEDIVLNLELNSDLTNEELWTRIQGLQDELNEMFPNGIEVGTSIDLSGVDSGEAGFLEKLNALILEAGMSVDQVNAVLAGMGFTANFATEPQKVEIREPDKVTTHHSIQNKRVTKMEDGSTAVEWDDVTTTTTEPGEVHEGEVDAYSLETSEPGTTVVPKINSLTKTGSGAMNNYSSTNKGGTRTPGGGTKSNKGGGGDKSKKEFKPKDRDTSEAKKYHKRYENLTNVLEDMADALERISGISDDAWGAGRVRQLKTYNAQLLAIAKTNSLLIDETKKYYAEDKAALMNSELGALAVFNNSIGEYGGLANPETLRRYLEQQSELAKAAKNAAIDTYNTNASDDETAQAMLDAADEAYSDRQDQLDKLEELLNQYLETQDLLRERIDEQVERIRDYMAHEIEAISYKLEFRLEIHEGELARLEKLVDRLGDAGIISGDSIKYLGTQIERLTKVQDSHMKAVGEYKALIDGLATNGDLQKTFIEKYGQDAFDIYMKNGGLPSELMEKLVEEGDALVENIENMIDKLLEGLDGFLQQIDDYFKKFENNQHEIDVANAELDKLQEVLDFKGTNFSTAAGRAAQRSINDARLTTATTAAMNNRANLKQATYARDQMTKKYEESNAKYQAAVAAYEKTQSEADRLHMEQWGAQANTFRDKMNELDDQVKDLEVQVQNDVSEIFAAAQEALEDEKEMAIMQMGETIGGIFWDIRNIGDSYSKTYEWLHSTLDDYDKNYYLTKMENQYNDAIEDMDPEQLGIMSEWYEKLNEYKKEGVEMSQEEADLLQKALDLAIERANFEEANEAKKKNTMRLQRDASGNYSYVYSGEDADETGAEDKLLQLEFEYKKMFEDLQDTANENILNIAAEITDLISNINYQLYYTDENYRKMIDAQIQQLYQRMQAAAQRAQQTTEIMGNGIKDYAYDFAQSAAGITTQTTSLEEMFKKLSDALVGEGGYVPGSSGGFYGQWMEAQKEAAEKINIAGGKIGEDFGLIEEVIGTKITTITGTHLVTLDTSMATTQKHIDENCVEIVASFTATEDGIHTRVGDYGTDDESTIIGHINMIAAEVDDLQTTVDTDLSKIIDSMNAWLTKHNNIIDSAIEKIRAYLDWLDKMKQKQLEDLDKQVPDPGQVVAPTEPAPGNPTTPTGPTQPTGPIGSTQPTGPSGLDAAKADATLLAYSMGNWARDWYKYPNDRRVQTFRSHVGDALYNQAVEYAKTSEYARNVGNGGWGSITKYGNTFAYWNNTHARELRGFDTGGYTGNDEGLAFLHEKELVLNAEDTKNILAAVAMMRQTVMGQFGGINGALSGVAGGISNIATSMTNNHTQAVDQQVRIEASFPGVSVAAEIEEAFNSLINQAAQYNIKK